MSARRDAVLFVLLSLFWGVSFVAIKAGLDSLPPVLFAAIRYDVAGLLMLAYAAVAVDDLWPDSRADWIVVLVGATLVIALYNALLFLGEQGVTSAVAAILIAANPILATAFSRSLLPDQRLTATGVAGLALGFLGVVLVAWPDGPGPLVEDLAAPGLVLAAAAAIALGSVLIQRVDGDISTESRVAWSNALGAVLLHALSFALPSETPAAATFDRRAILAVLYLAVLASAVGYFVYFELLERLGAVEINLVSYAVPAVAAVFGWALLDETVDPLAAVGFLVVFAGFALLKRDALAEEVAGVRGRFDRATGED